MSTPWVSECVEIRPTPDRGRGYFAKNPITKGSLLLSESPLVSFPDQKRRYADFDNGDTYSLVYEVLSRNLESSLASLYIPTSPISDLFDSAPPDLLSAFPAAPNLPELLSCVALNSIGTAYYPERVDFSPYDESQATGIYPAASLFNHSCTPNAFRYSALTVRAARDIQAGEEVCISYIPTEVLCEKPGIRHEYLEGRDFLCACNSTGPSPSEAGTGAETPKLDLDVQTKAELSLIECLEERKAAIEALLTEEGEQAFLVSDLVYLLKLLAACAENQAEKLQVWDRITALVDSNYPEYDFTRVVARVEAGRRAEARELARFWYGVDDQEFNRLFQ